MTIRYYFALTNDCNRECEMCCTYSRPGKSTYLTFERYQEILPKEGRFEIQLEGGEPLMHPNLEDMIKYAQDTGRCDRVILGTNGVLLPYKYSNRNVDREKSIAAIKLYFLRFNPPFLLKPSINSHLISRDRLHLDKMEVIKDTFKELKVNGDYDLKFNVRRMRKPLSKDDDEWLVEELKKRDLDSFSNIFFYQRYGFGKDRTELELPFIVQNPVEFHLISPDGKDYGTDLIARSEGMKELK